jgi:hypothetical protein
MVDRGERASAASRSAMAADAAPAPLTTGIL